MSTTTDNANALADGPATLARLKRRARRTDAPPPTVEHFVDLAAVLAAAEAIAVECRQVRNELAQRVADARAAGHDVVSLEEMGAAFGATKQGAGKWGTRRVS